jgi:L-rhamnonate dehydratase
LKISAVEALHLRLPTVLETHDGTQDVLLIRVGTDEGLEGVGEVSSCSHVGRAIVEAPRSAAQRHGLREILLGRDPSGVEELWLLMEDQTRRYGRCGITMSTIGGVELALWDLRGKALGLPLYELLGGRKTDRVRAYGSFLFGATPEETAERTREACGQGFTAVKLGWGPFGRVGSVDVEHVKAAREAAGDEVQLMVDAGCAWDARTALQRATLFAEYGVAWLEEPLARDDIEGYRWLSERSPIPVAGGELETTVDGFRLLLEQGRIDVVQPDLTICGGITPATRVAEIADHLQRRTVPHSFSTAVGLLASLHWTATRYGGDLIEYCTSPSPLMRELITSLPPLQNGFLPVPETAGNGVDLDHELLAKYHVP